MLLGEISRDLSMMFAVTPMISTAIVEHVFQEILKQFYQRGETYLPNIGLLRYSSDGCHELVPCNSFVRTVEKMEAADKSEEISMALIQKRIERCLRRELKPQVPAGECQGN